MELSVFSTYVFYMVSFIISSFLISASQDSRRKKYFFLLEMIGLSIPIIIGTFRDGVGTDFYSYFQAYSLKGPIDIDLYLSTYGMREIVSYTIFRVSYLLGSFNVFLFIYSCGTVLFAYFGLKRIVPKKFLFISFYTYLFIFYLQSFNIIRQGLAIAAFIWGIKYIFERKPVKFFLLILLISQIHTSIIVTIPVYFIVNKKGEINKKIFLLVLCGYILFSYSNQKFIQFFSNVESFEKYGIYLTNPGNGENKDIIIKVIVLLIMLIFYNKIKIESAGIILSLMIYSFIFGFIGFSGAFLKRFGLYFDVFQVVSLAYVGSVFKNKYESLLYKILVFMVISFYVYILYVYTSNGDVVPYIFNWKFNSTF